MFLRSLPDPLIPESIFSRMQTQKPSEREISVEDLRNLPPTNRAILKRLLDISRLVIAHSDQNRMESRAIATVLGPNILRLRDGVDPHMDNQTRMASLINSDMSVSVVSHLLNGDAFLALWKEFENSASTEIVVESESLTPSDDDDDDDEGDEGEDEGEDDKESILPPPPPDLIPSSTSNLALGNDALLTITTTSTPPPERNDEDDGDQDQDQVNGNALPSPLRPHLHPAIEDLPYPMSPLTPLPQGVQAAGDAVMPIPFMDPNEELEAPPPLL